MERRIASLITLPLLSAAFLFACGSLPAYGGNSTADNGKANVSSKKTPEKKMEKVILEGVKLITPEKEIEANVDTADFTRLVHDIDTAVEYMMQKSPQTITLLINVVCTPDGKTAQVMAKGVPEEKLLSQMDKLKQAIDSIENVKVKSGKIEFSMQYTINV